MVHQGKYRVLNGRGMAVEEAAKENAGSELMVQASKN